MPLSERVKEFFREMGIEKLPRIEYVENVGRICKSPERALGCVDEKGSIYVDKRLSGWKREGTEVHEGAHKKMKVGEVGARTIEYLFLRKMYPYLRDYIYAGVLLGFTDPYYLERGVSLWEHVWVSRHLRGDRLGREAYEGRDPEGLVRILNKLARLNHEEVVPTVATSLYLLKKLLYNRPGSLAIHLLLGSTGLSQEDKYRIASLLRRVVDHVENILQEEDPSSPFYVKNMHLLGEVRAFLYTLGLDRERDTLVGKSTRFYRDRIVSHMLAHLLEEYLHNNNLTHFLGMMTRPPSEG